MIPRLTEALWGTTALLLLSPHSVATQPPAGKPAHLSKYTGPLRHVSFTRDGKSLATVSWNESLAPQKALANVRVWDVAKGSQRAALKGSGEVHAVAFTPDGKTLIAGGGDQLQPGEVHLWDPVQRQI